MYISLDPDSDIPLFEQITRSVTLAIARGELRPGDQLASVRALATDFGINPATVQKAYEQLRLDGLIRTSEKRKSVVAPRPARPSAEREKRLSEELRALVARGVAQGIDVDSMYRQLRATNERTDLP